ncbi:MAG: hypothetical protein HS126_00170 [Anaerolineales bacterium]|nr:hypothetical protein [Anaerolineales bacterium]
MLTWTPVLGRLVPTLFTSGSNRGKGDRGGATQVKQLCQARPDRTQQGLDVIVTDGHYGNHHFWAGPGISLCHFEPTAL